MQRNFVVLYPFCFKESYLVVQVSKGAEDLHDEELGDALVQSACCLQDTFSTFALHTHYTHYAHALHI